MSRFGSAAWNRSSQSDAGAGSVSARLTIAGSTAQAMLRCCSVAVRTALSRLDGSNGATASGDSVSGTAMLSRVDTAGVAGSQIMKDRATPTRTPPVATLTAIPRGPQPSDELSRPIESAGTESVTERAWPGRSGSVAWSVVRIVPTALSVRISQPVSYTHLTLPTNREV